MDDVVHNSMMIKPYYQHNRKHNVTNKLIKDMTLHIYAEKIKDIVAFSVKNYNFNINDIGERYFIALRGK